MIVREAAMTKILYEFLTRWFFAGRHPAAGAKARLCQTSKLILTIGIAFIYFGPTPFQAATTQWVKLNYTPDPVDNPLKGLVPYIDASHGEFPHSLEFAYIPLSSLVVGDGQFDWKPIESLLNAAARRGNQAIFRVFLEYPGKTNALPAFLIKDGLKNYKWALNVGAGQPPEVIITPDYANVNLRKLMTQFIAAMGKKYDGDPRIGFITAGLLGIWGEWHDTTHDELFANKQVQKEIMDAYESAFKTTPVLLRYPVGADDKHRASNSERRMGYHDDSFAWATLETGGKDDSWFFARLLKTAGPNALDKWKMQPIGGEIRPEAWGRVFDREPEVKQIQDFRKCVEATHVTWLMDSGMFSEDAGRNPERVKRAEEEVRRMGYEFHVPAVMISQVIGENIMIKVEIENRGVAPFYYDWPVQFGLLDSSGNAVKISNGRGKLTGLLPDAAPLVWNENVSLQGVKAGEYKLALRVPNPIAKGKPLRFANKTQDQDASGWLTLGPVRLN
jgi:hypothetical protein